MGSIAAIIEHFKTHWEQQFDRQLVERICGAVGYMWRDRCLSPWITVGVFLLQILHGNTACTHLPHLAGRQFSASAYCQARARLPLAVFRRLVSHLVATFRRATADAGGWLGHRVWIVDGSSFSMPDTDELNAHFGKPSGQRSGCGFPTASILALFDADRGFCSYAHSALLAQRGVLAMFRAHQRQIVSFQKGRGHAGKHPKRKRKGKPTSRFVRKLSRYDQWVDYLKPRQRPRWMPADVYAALPDVIRVREFRFWVHRRGYRTRQITVVTTLLDPERYPLAELARLYGQRWQVEIFFRFFKHVLGCRHLLSHDPNGIKIQTYCAIIACLLISLWTGRKPTLRTYEMICYYFCGLASEDEMLAHLAKLPAQAA